MKMCINHIIFDEEANGWQMIGANVTIMPLLLFDEGVNAHRCLYIQIN